MVFGYVKPFQPNLRMRDFEAYKGIYCALCKTLGKRYGLFARMALSYDGTFLAVLSAALEADCPGFRKGRCVCNPLKKCTYAVNAQESLQKAATATVLLTYHSLRDDIRDSRFGKRLRSRFLSMLGRGAYRKAAQDAPGLEQQIAAQMDRQSLAEQNPEQGGMDAAADPSGRMLSSILSWLGKDEIQRRVLGEMGYYLGRWVYYIDAADDLLQDSEEGNFNPFLQYRNQPGDLNQEKAKALRQYANEVLNSCVARLLEAYALLDLKQMNQVVDNILTEGLADTQRIVLFAEEKKHVRSI